MGTIKYLNLFAITLPFLILAAYPVYEDIAVIYALYSTMITGAIQVLLGLILFIRQHGNKFIIGYLTAVALFFALWFINVNAFYSEYMTYLLLPIPLILAIYFTFLIYKKIEP